MEEQIFYPEQFQNAEERTDAVLHLCDMLIQGEIGMFSFNGELCQQGDIESLLAKLLQYFPDDYEREKVLKWGGNNNLALAIVDKNYMDSHENDIEELADKSKGLLGKVAALQ